MTLAVECTGRGAPLFLLHGWAFHSGAWDGFGASLAERFEVHFVDLPGHGNSHDVPLAGLDELADGLAPRIPEGSLLCGWSMGAIVAQRIARRDPARVRAMALIAGTPSFVARADWPHGMPAGTLQQFARGLGEDPANALDTFVRLNALGGRDARAAIRALSDGLRSRATPRQAALAWGLEILRNADLRADAAHLAVPTCLIHGVHDRVVPVEAGRWLARTIPGARLVEMKHSGHLPFYSERAEVVRAIEALGG